MSYEINSEEELERWEQEHDYCLVWGCPQCSYSYEATPHHNEALNCPHCKIPTVQNGESYSA